MIPPLARRFVAGERPAQALDHVRELNERNVGAIVNLLGEHYDSRDPADDDAEIYRRLVDDIGRSDLRACVSVKPSQIGLSIDESVFRENLAEIVDVADEHGVFVWIDMEDHTTTDATLDAFEHPARERGGDVGVCVQANLKRTESDLKHLADVPGKVRLVKGAYDEPAAVAYQDKARVDQAYRDALSYMFGAFEDGIAVGSHDQGMIEYAQDLHDRYGTPFEIQMLMGVREDVQFELADASEVWQYVPYGGRWASYFYRRVMERKENALFALRALAG
jgi:proline dehydrogenase